ncbi:MAG: hypothetical protein ACK5PG_15655 [Lysobacterales bacterium]|jgi:hypothetical protein
MKQQRGFATTEYIIVGLVIVWVLLAPMDDIPPFNGRSIVVTLIDVMKQVYANFAYGIGLPRFR